MLDYIAGCSRIHILRLRRRNLLRVEVSRARALISGRWQWTGRAPSDAQIPVRLDAGGLVPRFEAADTMDETLQRRLAGNPLLEVWYEDLSDSPATTLGRIQDFLSIPRRELSSPTIRPPTRTPRDSILNYSEVAERLSGTRWARFLEE